jgi:hypothetical protein
MGGGGALGVGQQPVAEGTMHIMVIWCIFRTWWQTGMLESESMEVDNTVSGDPNGVLGRPDVLMQSWSPRNLESR